MRKGGWAEGVMPISFLSPGSPEWWLPEAGASLCQLQTPPPTQPSLDLRSQSSGAASSQALGCWAVCYLPQQSPPGLGAPVSPSFERIRMMSAACSMQRSVHRRAQTQSPIRNSRRSYGSSTSADSLASSSCLSNSYLYGYLPPPQPRPHASLAGSLTFPPFHLKSPWVGTLLLSPYPQCHLSTSGSHRSVLGPTSLP